MVTYEEIEKVMKEKEVPHGAVFADGSNKRLAWGGFEILNAIFENKLNWVSARLDMGYEEYCKLRGSLESNDMVIVFCVTNESYNGLDVQLLCKEDLSTTIELAGGLENYLKIGG